MYCLPRLIQSPQTCDRQQVCLRQDAHLLQAGELSTTVLYIDIILLVYIILPLVGLPEKEQSDAAAQEATSS